MIGGSTVNREMFDKKIEDKKIKDREIDPQIILL
jgi:hypothetical protein